MPIVPAPRIATSNSRLIFLLFPICQHQCDPHCVATRRTVPPSGQFVYRVEEIGGQCGLHCATIRCIVPTSGQSVCRVESCERNPKRRKLCGVCKSKWGI